MNMRHAIRCFLLIAAVLYSSAYADGFIRQYDPFSVTVSGTPLKLPFYGGLNDPKPSFVDLNGDGLIDLCIGERTGKLVYIKNTGTLTTPDWLPVDGRLGNRNIGTWHTFIDIDNDGDLDLFCDNKRSGTAFLENIGTPTNYNFVLADSNFGTPDTSFQTEVNNTPKFADIDNDGDYDFFYGNPSGYLWFYRNIGTPESPAFEFVTDYYDSVFAFPGAGPHGGGMAQAQQNPQHGFSNICFTDIDNDGDLDLFWGDIFNANMYWFKNFGTATTSYFDWETETYLPTTTSGYNHAAFADLDNDGDKDLLVGAANYSDIDNLLLFTNTGTVDSAVMVETTRNYLTNIDVGTGCMPAFGDVDGDGDFDLLLGGLTGNLAYYQNTGSATNPAFTFVTAQFQNINVLASSCPDLADIDHDGDLDLFIGTAAGRIQFWRNDGTPQNPTYVLADNFYQGIKTDRQAVVRLGDVNKDGLLDLIVGEWDFNSKANVRFYQNTGTQTVPAFTLVNAFILPVLTREFTIPRLYDWDKDGKPDIITGVYVNGLTWYRNTAPVGQFPDSLSLVAMPDTIPGSDEGYSLAATFVDIDGDGDDDLFIGEDDGGLSFYRNTGCCTGNTGDVNHDGNPQPNIVDLTFLVNFLFRSGASPVCMAETNINGVGTAPTISDLTYLVNFLFRSGPPPAMCQ